MSARGAYLESPPVAGENLTGETRTRNLLGVDIAVTDYDSVLARIDAMIAARERGYVCCLAVHPLMLCRRDPELAAAVAASTMTVPDGMPLVWALRRLGESLEDRVYGPELMRRTCARAPARGHAVFLYGGHDPGALAELEDALRRFYPGIEIAGGWSPPHRPLTAAERREVAQRINDSGADIVWVGIGASKQERWMVQMRGALEAPVLVGVGAAFDLIPGRVPQAPSWMQRRGLEWAYRFAREPRRLGPRYLRNNPAFLAAFARQWWRERRDL